MFLLISVVLFIAVGPLSDHFMHLNSYQIMKQ